MNEVFTIGFIHYRSAKEHFKDLTKPNATKIFSEDKLTLSKITEEFSIILIDEICLAAKELYESSS